MKEQEVQDQGELYSVGKEGVRRRESSALIPSLSPTVHFNFNLMMTGSAKRNARRATRARSGML